MFTFYYLPYRGEKRVLLFMLLFHLPLLSGYTLRGARGAPHAQWGRSDLCSAVSAPNSDPWEVRGRSPAPGHGVPLKPPKHEPPSHFSPPHAAPARTPPSSWEGGRTPPGPSAPSSDIGVGKAWLPHAAVAGFRLAHIKNI